MERFKLTLLLCFCIALGLFFSRLVRQEEAKSKKKPRFVLLYATCTLNKDYISPYRSGIRYTPNLKAFATESTTFNRHQTESPFSGAAYASLFTGTSLYQHKIYFHPALLEEKNYLIAEAFRDNGYDTYFWDGHMMTTPKLGYTQGVSPKNVVAWGGRQTLSSQDGQFASILKRLNSDSDYKAFVQVSFTMTHAPYSDNSPISTTERFCKDFPEECKNVTKEEMEKYIPIYRKNHIQLQYRFEETVQALRFGTSDIASLADVLEVTYKSSVHLLDKIFGATVEAIRNTGLIDQSLIIFTADHGEMLYRDGSPVEWMHGYLEPEILSIPLMIRLPRYTPHVGQCSQVTRAIDVFPTVGTLCGLHIPRTVHFDGKDLSAGMLGEQNFPHLVAYSSSELRHPAAALDNPNTMNALSRDGDTIYFTDGKSMKVFDLTKPDWDKKDLFDTKNEKQIQMQNHLKAYRKLVIQNYRPLTSLDKENMKEVREHLRSLGYLQ